MTTVCFFAVRDRVRGRQLCKGIVFLLSSLLIFRYCTPLVTRLNFQLKGHEGANKAWDRYLAECALHKPESVSELAKCQSLRDEMVDNYGSSIPQVRENAARMSKWVNDPEALCPARKKYATPEAAKAMEDLVDALSSEKAQHNAKFNNDFMIDCACHIAGFSWFLGCLYAIKESLSWIIWSIFRWEYFIMRVYAKWLIWTGQREAGSWQYSYEPVRDPHVDARAETPHADAPAEAPDADAPAGAQPEPAQRQSAAPVGRKTVHDAPVKHESPSNTGGVMITLAAVALLAMLAYCMYMDKPEPIRDDPEVLEPAAVDAEIV